MTRGARPRKFCALWAVILAAVALAAGPAAAAGGPAGRWAAQVEGPGGKKAEIYLVLAQKDGAWTGSLEDPLMGSAPVTALKVSATAVTFKFQPQGAPFAVNFSGSYVAGDDRVSGTFSLQGSSRFLKFSRVGAAPGDAAGDAVAAAAAAPDTATAAVRTKHPYRLAVTGRAGWWASLHSVKVEQYDLNDMTAAAPAFDGAVKWCVLDGFTVFARGVRGGQAMTQEPEKLAKFAALGLGGDSYLVLDGIEVGVSAYLGSRIMPNSRLNPYVTGGAGRYDWSLTTGGRGTAPLAIEQRALEGADLGGWFGMGTEYALASKLALEVEWAWRFYLTGDTAYWRNSEGVWGNTLAFALSAGLTYGF